ncbi:LOW QUALITY PROTEIN: histo-blood group ABO system transferase 1-like [Trichechus inunguis]
MAGRVRGRERPQGPPDPERGGRGGERDAKRGALCILPKGRQSCWSHLPGLPHHLGRDFDSAILDTPFRNTTIGLTVFAIKRYVVFLKVFLETADKCFMVGHKVNYYIFTDRPADGLHVLLQEGWQVVDLEVCNYPCWQGMSMHRMELISNFSEQRFLHEVDYLVCLDMDMRLSDHMDVEILFSLFGTLHPGFCASYEAFTYECCPLSQAHIPRDEGDSYYAGGFFGGSVIEVHRLTKACHQAMKVDHANHIEAEWHDESHLNKYLLCHKPTKVLSPEYLWDERMLCRSPFLRKLGYVAVPKNHQAPEPMRQHFLH